MKLARSCCWAMCTGRGPLGRRRGAGEFLPVTSHPNSIGQTRHLSTTSAPQPPQQPQQQLQQPLHLPPRLAGLTYWWGSVVSQFLTLVEKLAGEARCQPEPCTMRYWSKLLHRPGHVTYTTVAVSTSPPTCSPSSSLLALEARWKASSLLATGSGLVFFGMLTLHEAGQWACWGTMSRVERFFGMLALDVCRRRRGRGGGGRSVWGVAATSQLQFIDKVSSKSGAVGEETVELPQLQPIEHGHCRRCATTDAGCFRRRKTVKVLQLQYN